ncbi:MAG: hypothetical protein IKX76_06230 [Eubacterium sp.]|nr:hypothetical protein [Eubacterium sp.]
MSIYSSFILENHNLSDYQPAWMKAERYEYCEQFTKREIKSKGFFKSLTQRFTSVSH